MNIEYEIVSYGWNDELGYKSLDEDVSNGVVALFQQNYPDSHDQGSRVEDMNARLDKDSLEDFVAQGRTFLVAEAEVGRQALGFVEMRVIPREHDTLAQLVWIIIDSTQRGQGLATSLHGKFLEEATRQYQGMHPLVAQLAVHPDNPAGDIYRHWGYHEVGETSKGGLFMMGLVSDMIDQA